MSINVGGSAGGDTRFTSLVKHRGKSGTTYLKTSNTTAALQDSTDFSAAITARSVNPFWDAAQLQPAENTLEQTIVDITGEGVLTNVITPYNASIAVVTYTVRIEVDGGAPIEYTLTTSAQNQTLVLGYTSNYNASLVSSTSVGLGSAQDYGFSTNEFNILHTPLQVITVSDYGLKFKTSLRVTVQSSVNMSTTAEAKAYALYTNYIPKGI